VAQVKTLDRLFRALSSHDLHTNFIQPPQEWTSLRPHSGPARRYDGARRHMGGTMHVSGSVRAVAVRKAAILALVLGASSSCATAIPAPSPTPPAIARTAAPSPSAPTSRSTAAITGAGCDTRPWHASPISSARQVAVPPVPVIRAVRTAAHPECGYDRFVLDISGPVPGYEIRYVANVTADPSGAPVSLPGRSYLLITLRPANAHTAAGAATITRRAQALSYPELRGYVLGGDFEGVVTLALGLQSRAAIRVGEIPGHWYVDIRTKH
jgi:hypothetical protein